MLNLTVVAYANDYLKVKWPLGGDPCRDNATTPQCTFSDTTHSSLTALKFRAVLGGADPVVRLERMTVG